jgi:iron(II)-dependent oxidoreductase
MIGAPVTIDRAAVLDRFTRVRARTRALFALLDDSAYYTRPIPLRNPIVFYEGHLPAFAVNTLVKRALGRAGIDRRLEEIFARGIDPETEATAIARGDPAWPARETVRDYAAAADRLLADVIATADLERDDQPLLERAQALWTILEHEEMHQETLAYMWHQLPYAQKRKPAHYVTAPPRLVQAAPAASRVRIPAGSVTMGTDLRETPFAWDNERPVHCASIEAFTIDVHNVTNREFLEFVEDQQAPPPAFWEREDGRWYWRGMFERVPLPDAWPVYVTAVEAQAFARWRGGRLPTEAEFHRAAFGTPDGRERQHPWGDTLPPRIPANVDFRRWDPDPVGSHPDGASAFGVHDLAGNGWEWTSTTFAPFNGFEPLPSYPEYSVEFFDGDHLVLKGGSPVTPRTLLRRGFRNWFRPNYPYVYATFRCVER